MELAWILLFGFFGCIIGWTAHMAFDAWMAMLLWDRVKPEEDNDGAAPPR